MSYRTSKRIFVGCLQRTFPVFNSRKRDKKFVRPPERRQLHTVFIDFSRITSKPDTISLSKSKILISTLLLLIFINKKLIVFLVYIQHQLLGTDILHFILFVIFTPLKQSIFLTLNTSYHIVAPPRDTINSQTYSSVLSGDQPRKTNSHKPGCFLDNYLHTRGGDAMKIINKLSTTRKEL